MAKISIFSCPKVTRKLGCSNAQCLYDMRNRIGSFEQYAKNSEAELVGVASCPGCPTETVPERIINQMLNLTDFDVDAIHFANCLDTFCAFRYRYQTLIQRNFPNIKIVSGACRIHMAHDEEKQINCKREQ